MDASLRPTLEEILTLLEGVTLDIDSAEQLPTQGFNSIALAVDASFGPAVLHINKRPQPEQLYQKVPEKLKAIAERLEGDGEVPTAQIVAIGHLSGGGYFVLQNRMPGEPLGTQEIKNNEVVPLYTHHHAPIALVDAERIFAHLHTLSVCKGFGHITVDGEGALTAPHPTWRAFIEKESARWLSELEHFKHADEAFVMLHALAFRERERIIDVYADVCAWTRPLFVHGDLNPGNILAEGDTVTALLDFEWAVSGDPAWEFAFANSFPSSHYYEYSTEDASDLERRKRVYRFFWLLWGSQVHVHNDDPFLCRWLLSRSLESAAAL